MIAQLLITLRCTAANSAINAWLELIRRLWMAVIGNNCIVAGHSIVTEGSDFPDNSIIAGSPAKLLKTRDSSVANKTNADFYVLNAKNYRQGIHRITEDELHSLGNL